MITAAPGMNRLEGPRLRLRLVEPDDASYIHGLRMDPRYNQHLSPVTGTADDQRAWIERYKAREAEGREYYYLIERRDNGVTCGVVRLYDIAGDSFTWGSWILDHNKPAKAALESAVLSFSAGFEQLACLRGILDVRRENAHAQSFYRRFGMTETGSDEMNIYFEYQRDAFEAQRARFMSVIHQEQAQ